MKKFYETPVAEKVEFQYQEQVVASSAISCDIQVINVKDDTGNCSVPSDYKPLN